MALFGRNPTTVGLDIGSGLIKLVAMSHRSGEPVFHGQPRISCRRQQQESGFHWSFSAILSSFSASAMSFEVIPAAFRIANTVVAPWVSGYKKNVYYNIHPWHYLDIDPARQRAVK